MKNMFFTASLMLLVGAPAWGDATESELKEARAIFQNARQAASKLRSVSYNGSHLGDGTLAIRLPITDGKVDAAWDSSSKFVRVKISGTRMPARAKAPMEFEYVNAGRWITLIDHARRTFERGATATVRRPEEDTLFPQYYLTKSAFERELRAPLAKVVGTEKVDDVECVVVEVSYDPAGRSMSKFSIGQEDMLLRRVVQSSRVAPNNAEIFVARNLQANPKFEVKHFAPLGAPTGYRTLVRPSINPAAAGNRSANGLLAKGTEAPEWTLPDGDGKDVSLKSLRGQVVVIDFWASWCGPCKMAMPYLQKLSDDYKDKAVKVYSINCRERGGDARARQYLKTKGFTYPQLFKGDKAANDYLVRGIPTIYVIGTDGKILMAERGFRPNKMSEISKVIDEQLNKKQARVDARTTTSVEG